MNIHKFNTKPNKSKTSKTIKWLITLEVRNYIKKIDSDIWGVYSRENIILQPKEVKPLTLGIGFIMSKGTVFTSVPNSLRIKRCSLQNEVHLENTIDIITSIANNSKEVINIEKNNLLCYVCYKKL